MYHVTQWYKWCINIATRSPAWVMRKGFSGRGGGVPIEKVSNRWVVEFSTTQI
jgi:hypothetical protein